MDHDVFYNVDVFGAVTIQQDDSFLLNNPGVAGAGKGRSERRLSMSLPAWRFAYAVAPPAFT